MLQATTILPIQKTNSNTSILYKLTERHMNWDAPKEQDIPIH
uniref:Uncharacterized protein n=1 Tax=Arundo donax TaxID=35708 RepID=A0A0A9ASH8_ARUDO